MNQPFNFDPKKMNEAMEQWQKLWLSGWQPVQKASPPPTPVFDNSAWQNMLNQQTELWQKNLTKMFSMSGNNGATNPFGAFNPLNNTPETWQQLPFFQNMQKMYEHTCDFVEQQLEKNPAYAKLSADQQDNIGFMTRQYLSALHPNNYLMTNPEALQEAYQTQGQSLIKGMQNYLSDLEKGRITMSEETSFVMGENIAATAGKVVLKNELIELIQYTPTAAKVYAKPLLIVPPCVNKYYLMDLGPQKSLVEYYVDQGYNVFLVSWRSAVEETKHFTWDTYVERGVISAINAVTSISKQDSINALGFCIGGLILSTALCVMKARGEQRVDNLILMTSMADHTEPGDIKYFLSEDVVRMREAKMAQGGIISGLELQATFSALRPDDLIWNYVQNNYLKGKTPSSFDLLYWNNDSVDLPLPMHTFFLRQFYLNNALTKPGSMSVCGVPIDLSNLDMPIYFFSAEGDHIVPWLAVYSGLPLYGNAAERRFVLGESGHIAGAINPVSKDRRSYWTGNIEGKTAEEWRASAENHKGSWWKDLNTWLSNRSGNLVAAPRTLGNTSHKAVAEAPGEYVQAKAMNVVKAHLV